MAADLPPRIRRMSRVPTRLLGWGVPLGPLLLLRTTGRRTGLTRTVPVARTRLHGSEWLVSPFGDTAWTLNARADGRAEIGRGRRFREVDLLEVRDQRKVEVLVHYRRQFRLVPFVRNAFAAGSEDSPAAMAGEAADHPVFLVAAR